ncbi:MAG: hypothetical protein IKK34_07515 [Clostridia bacterium]|nr:hypothetical protein [Clostridia bacterium]
MTKKEWGRKGTGQTDVVCMRCGLAAAALMDKHPDFALTALKKAYAFRY